MTELPNKVSVEDLPEGMKKNVVQKYEGVNYHPGLRTTDYVKVVGILKNLRLVKDDIISVGFPRSGNHWTYELTNMILNQNIGFTAENFVETQLELSGDTVQERIDQRPKPRNLCCHLRMHLLPNEVTEKKTKVVYIIRNPKDAMVSQFKFTSSLKQDHIKFSGDWNEFFEAWMKGQFVFGYWFDHVLSADKFMEDHPEVPFFVHSFEKMKENPIQSINNLSKFLDKPLDLGEDIAKAVEFNQMKAGTEKKFNDLESEHMESKGNIIRQGQVGNWKNWFTVSQNERFNELMKEKMAGSQLYKFVEDYV